jgi:hypothetical protein
MRAEEDLGIFIHKKGILERLLKWTFKAYVRLFDIISQTET